MKMAEFSTGLPVRHPIHGEGIVEDVNYGSYLVLVSFNEEESSEYPLGRPVHPSALERSDGQTEAELERELAIKLLQRHGYAVRVYGPEEVNAALSRGYSGYGAIADFEPFREQIVKTVMESDDWKHMGEERYDANNLMSDMLDGVFNDHPEWFPNNSREEVSTHPFR